MDRRENLLAAIGVILVAGFYSVCSRSEEVITTGMRRFIFNMPRFLTGESPDVYNEFEFRPPLFFSLILAGSFLISSSLLSAHLTVAGLSSLAIILVYIVGKELYSRQTAIIAAAIYATSPLGIILSHDILVDPILPIFWLLTAFSLIKALRTDKRTYFVLTGLTAALAVLMKFTSLVIIPAVALVVSFSYFKETDFDINSILNKIKGFVVSDRNWLMASGFFIGILPYLLWSYMEFGSALHVFMTGWAKSGARDAFMTYINGWNKYILAPFYVGVFSIFPESRSEKDGKLSANYLLHFYVSTATVFVANKETRFLMPAIPFIVLMAAEGLRKLRTGRHI